MVEILAGKGPGVHTPGAVKLLLPARHSGGSSHGNKNCPEAKSGQNTGVLLHLVKGCQDIIHVALFA